MRVISGTLKSRQFKSPRTRRTHPMGDKVRGALFNVLGDIKGLTVLDAFAGSGALAIESVSRGARDVYAIEKDSQAYTCIVENIESLGIENIKATRANVSSWSSNNADIGFDVVLCDPPYDAVPESLIRKLSQHLNPSGTLVVSWPASEKLPKLPHLRLIQDQAYADAQLAFYKK